MSQLQSASILKSFNFRERKKIISFLITSETFGIKRSIDILARSFPKRNRSAFQTLLFEFSNRNPDSIEKIYVQLLTNNN